MFSQYTYKQKFFGLIVLFVLLLLVANKKSFSITKTRYNEVKEIEKKLLFVNNTNQDILSLTKEIAYLDDVIGKQGIPPDIVQQEILDFTSAYQQVKLVTIDEIHYAQGNGFDIFSNRLVLEGTFNSLSAIVYDFEKRFKQSRLVSINYEKIKNYNNRKDKLQVSIIFQNYEKINEN